MNIAPALPFSGLYPWLFSYLLNAVWQVPLVAGVAGLICRLFPRSGPAVKHRIWVAALALEVLLPAASLLPLQAFASFSRWLAARLGSASAHTGHTRVAVVLGALHVRAGFAIPLWLLSTLMLVYAISFLYFIAKLLWHAALARRTARRAHPFPWTGEARVLWDLYRARFGVPEAALAISCDVSGPATVGVTRRVLLLPHSMAFLPWDEDLQAALAHEFAHMRRRDYGKNLLYRFLSAPLAFHPCLHITLAQVAETREMMCDSLAADAVAGPDRYAKSLLRLASSLAAIPSAPTLHAIGIFDASTLEKRIMNLRFKRLPLPFAHRAALAAASAMLALGACTSAVALGLHVSSPGAQTAEAAEPAVQLSGGVAAGNILNRVNPVYPQAAKDAKISGSVILKARIGKDGNLEALQVISGPPELRASAWEAVRQWTYKPYLLNGNPVAVDTTITVNYSLGN